MNQRQVNKAAHALATSLISRFLNGDGGRRFDAFGLALSDVESDRMEDALRRLYDVHSMRADGMSAREIMESKP